MKTLSAVLLSAAMLAVGASAASAQDKYPSQPIKVLIPYAPGGATDRVARVLGDGFREVSGQSLVIENKPGAGGIIANELLVNSKHDGYTLLLGNVSTNSITPILYKGKYKIDFGKDIVPVMRLVDVPAFIVVTTNNFPVNNFKELVEHIKKNPGKVRAGHVGVGSYPHYDGVLFEKKIGGQMVHIPNKDGASGVIKDMLAGDVQVAFLNVASTAAMVKAGKLKAVALVNDARLPEYPDVPTMKEVGQPDIGTSAWQGLFAPAGVPEPVMKQLFDITAKVMALPEVKKQLESQNFRMVPNKTQAEAKTWLGQDSELWRKAADTAKITVSE